MASMGGLGLFKQGWKWIQSQKQAFVSVRVAVICVGEKLVLLIDRHWPLVYSWCMVAGRLLFRLTSTTSLVCVLLILGAAATTIHYLGFTPGLLMIGLYGILIMWIYGYFWITAMLFIAGGYMFSLNHARFLILMATAYAVYCINTRDGLHGVFLLLNLSFISNDILNKLLQVYDDASEGTHDGEQKEWEQFKEDFSVDSECSPPAEDAEEVVSSLSSCTTPKATYLTGIHKDASSSKVVIAESTSLVEMKRIMNSSNHYEVLGFLRNKIVDPQILKKEYHKKVLLVHPDKNMGSPLACESFKRLQCAYEILADLTKKKNYDEQLRKGESGRVCQRSSVASQKGGVEYRSEESRCIECTKCGNSHMWICTNRSKGRARWCQIKMQAETENFPVLDEKIGVPVMEDMISSSSFKGTDHVGDDSASYEKFILDMDSYWDELNERLSLSRMVNDTVIKGMVSAMVEEAAEKIASKEAEIAVLNEKLMSCKSHVAAGQNLEITSSQSLMMEAEIDERRLESCKSCLSSCGDCKCVNNVSRLRIMVENQIQWLKNDLQHLKSLDIVSREGIGPCNILHETKAIKKLLEVDQKVDVLKDILGLVFKEICAIICSKKVVLSELQWEHELQREINTIVLQDYVRGLQDEYETKLYHQTVFINNSNKNWQKKASELKAMRDELHAIMEEVNYHENFEEWTVTKRKDHFPAKVLGNHNFPSQPEENETMMMEKSGDSGENMLDFAHLNHMNKEELLFYFKTEMTKMRRRHDSALLEKTEELFRLKREFLKERGSSVLRKDKELEHLREKVPGFILKLDEILVEKEMLLELYNHDDELQSFKEKNCSLVYENKRVRNLLMEKTNELKCLSAQISDAESQKALHSSAEANYLNQLRKLASVIEDVKTETNFRDQLCNIMLRGLIDEHRCVMQDTEIKIKLLMEINNTIFRGVICDAITCMNPTISKYSKEKLSLEALLLQKENALRSEIEENSKLKQDVASLSSSMKEKENLNMSFEATLLEKENALRLEIEKNCELKQVIASISSSLEEKEQLASESGSTLMQQKQQLDIVHRELSMLRDHKSMREEQLSRCKLELISLTTRLNKTLQQNHYYELELDKLNEKLKLVSDALIEEETQKTMLLGVIEEKDGEQVKQLRSISEAMMELSKGLADLERHLIESSKRNESRLKVLSHQLNPLVQLASKQKKNRFLYKKKFETSWSNLQKAEAEVDLLGDDVEALLGLLGKIYLALDHYSPVLQHYPGNFGDSVDSRAKMSVDHFRSSLLGSPLRTSLVNRNGSSVDRLVNAEPNFRALFSKISAGNRRKGRRRVDCLRFGVEDPGFYLRKFGFLSDGIKVSCARESFPRTTAWITSLNSLWKEGLFLIRCSVFVSVISVAGMLVWYAQRKATSFVEAQLLPSACSILSEHLQRELDFGKVRSVSPLGITLYSCSIGPHREEFSCGEVPTLKLRIRPFTSLRRGKIVIDAVLSRPCLLVAQKEDFSWLGIPSPSEDGLNKHCSSEEGIDYRTKTIRLAREESAASWARQRVKAAREAAEMGYVVPEEHSSLFRDETLNDSLHLSVQPGRPSSFFCIDDHMHLKDHHCMDNSGMHGLEHTEVEKPFGARTGGLGTNFWSRIKLPLSRHRFKRNAKRKVVSERNFTSKQRNLKRSAVAATAYFRGLDRGKFSEPYSKQGSNSSDGGHEDTGSQMLATKDKAGSDAEITRSNGIDKTRSDSLIELVDLDNQEFKPQTSIEAADYISITQGSTDIERENGKLTDGGMEKQHLAEDHHSCLQINGHAIALDNGDLEKHHFESHHDDGVGFDKLKDTVGQSYEKSEDSGDLNCQGFIQKMFGMCTQMHQSKAFYPFQLYEIMDKIVVNEVFSEYLAGHIRKLKSYFSISAEDLSAEFVEGVTETSSKGIGKVLPITLDSVHFSGGTLMLLGYGDKEPREMVEVNGHIRLENHYSRVHVQLSGNCMEWRQDHTSQGGGRLSADVSVNIPEQKWHANLKIINLFAPLFEGILDIPVTWLKGRATGEIHICMSRGDSFPNLHGQLDVNGLSFHILDAPSMFSELTASLCFRGQRIFLHNASGWFGDAPLEASGDFGINPDDGEFHLMCQVPCVEVNALMKTLKIRPLLFPLAGSVTAVFNCQGPLVAPVFVGSGIISRKTSQTVSSFLPSSASEAVIENKEAGAVAAFDRIPFSHVSANFTFNLDNCVVDLYGIRACLLDGGEIRGAGSAWVCPEGEVDDTAMDINLSGNFLLDKVLHRYVPKGVQLMPLRIGELNGETRLSGSLSRPRFDIKWAAPKAEDSFGDARGDIIITHDNITVTSSSIAFDLYTKVQTSYHANHSLCKETANNRRVMPLIVEGVDLNLRLRDFELANFIFSSTFDSPRTLHLKATGKIKFQGKVVKTLKGIDDDIVDCKGNGSEQQIVDSDIARLVGDVSFSGISLNQLMLAPQLTGSLCISQGAVKLSAAGRPDESLSIEAIGPFWFSADEVRNLPLDELELASLRGTVQKAELQLNFQKRRGHGVLSVLRPKFSGVLGQALDVAARWSGDVVSDLSPEFTHIGSVKLQHIVGHFQLNITSVEIVSELNWFCYRCYADTKPVNLQPITVEKTVLEQASSRYELQGEYVLPGARDRYPGNKEQDGLFKKAMSGHLDTVISSMGRWRMRLEVPGAEVAEMLPLARLLSRSTDPAVQSRSKELFMQSLQSVGFCAESLHDQLKGLQSFFNWSGDDSILEDITLPGLAELRGHWNGSLDASGGGNGDTMADFDFHGEDWEWGNYKTQRIMAAGAYSNHDGLRLEKLFIQKDDATLHADGTLLGPVTNLHFAVLNFPVGLVPTVVQIIESSTSSSIHSLRQWLTPIKGILHMEGDLKGSLAKPECDVQIRLLDGTIEGIDLGRAEIVASITSTSRFLFNANFEPVNQSGHVHIQGSVPVTYVQNESEEEIEKDMVAAGGVIRIPVWIKESDRGSSEDINEKKINRDKIEEGWDLQLAESLKVLNWNMLDTGEVRINADIKDGGMTLITALCPYATWLHGYADIMLQVRGTVEQPIVDGSASFHRASVFSPVLRKPLTNFGVKEPVVEKKMEEAIIKPGVDVRLTDLKLILGPELRIVYPLILNFAVSGELELNGMAHPKCIRPKGILTFENGEVNLVATQARLKRDHLNIAKFEPELGLDPTLDLALVGSDWQLRIQSRASSWQDNLIVTTTRSVDQDALTPTESQLAESLLEGDGQLAFKKLATATLETLMPRIEGKGEFGQARWRLVYAPQIPSLLSLDPTVDPLKSLANNISFGTEVEVQLGKRLQASVVRQMKDSEMAMQWTLIYKLTSRWRYACGDQQWMIVPP
ncbi:hypothetical protein MUK42_06558 [Musa troglodytarum]|uniref:J domain-containing protein n=2 Tax=Musa troglodytarum TaxID=320322 RepID=A0A9E7I0T7_9LILI|nr:hypothetical protein MUK42_06558 [Musa troglodytarum]